MLLGEPLVGIVVDHRDDAEDPACLLPAEEDVLVDPHVAGQGQVLVDHLDAELAGISRAVEPDRLAVDEQLPLARRVEAREDLHERALAGPVVTDDAQDLAGHEPEVDAAEGVDVAEVLRDASCLDDRRRRARVGHRASSATGNGTEAAIVSSKPEISARPTIRCS